jgi:histone H3/H4
LGIDRTGFSPRVQQKIVHAGVNSSSYQQGSRDLAELSDLKIAPKPVERIVRKIGKERTDQRDAAVAADQRLPLMEKDTVANPQRSCPSVAMVSVDGGRIQIRSDPSEPKQDGHWRESKVAVLETYHSEVQQADPDPDVPRCFLDLSRTKEMVRGLGHPLPIGVEFEGESPTRKPKQATKKGCSRKARPGRPKRLVRSVVASRKCAENFGPMVHHAARERNFFGAPRKAYLGDGLPVNWTIQRRHFASFTPILDFVHALSYVFSAAFAGRTQAEGIRIYKRWIQAVWAGRAATILTELEERSAALGEPPSECADSDPRKLVFEALRYLKNNTDKMRYDEYRRRGLPIMTSAVESVIKMINKRVKGTEKFWSDQGAEAILQLRADHLSETDTMSRFWEARETNIGSGRKYRVAS